MRFRAGPVFSPQTPDQPPLGDELGPGGRAAAVAVVVAFTWLVQQGFKALLDMF